MESIAWRLSLPLFLGLFAFFNRWLTAGGALAGILVGAVVVIAGWAEASAIAVFLVFGTLVTKISKRLAGKSAGVKKSKSEITKNEKIVNFEGDEVKKGRTASQVLAVSAIPAAVCLMFSPAWVTFFGFPSSDVATIECCISLYFAYLACGLADTFASEIGVHSKKRPILLSSLKRVPTGTDGAVSFLGFGASLLGGFLMGSLHPFSQFSGIDGPVTSLDVLIGGTKFALIGTIGCILDSILGCVLQPASLMSAHPELWKQRNVSVNLLSGILTMIFDFAFQKYDATYPLAIVTVTLLMLVVSPLPPFWARKALHVSVSSMVLFVGLNGYNALINAIAFIIILSHIPSYDLTVSLWNRFGNSKKLLSAPPTPSPPSSPRQSGTSTPVVMNVTPSSGKPPSITPRSPGIVLFCIATAFVYSQFEGYSACLILTPMYFADPAAAIFGTLLSRDVPSEKKSVSLSSKTLTGALCFTLTSYLCLHMFSFYLGPTKDDFSVTGIEALAVASMLTLIELLSGPLDNILLPTFMCFYLTGDWNSIYFALLVTTYYYTIGGGNHSNLFQGLHAYYRFSRPHTIVGTSLSIFVMSAVTIYQDDKYTLSEQEYNIAKQSCLLAIFSALMANIYIVGLNQMYDIAIDKINKPYLPVASGEFTETFGWAIVLVNGLASLLVAYVYGNTSLLLTITAGNVMGTIYSVELPFLRWKQYPVLAATLIFTVRGSLVQIGFYEFVRESINNVISDPSKEIEPWYTSSAANFLIVFLSAFGTAIALFKDVPDISGDEQAGINTLSVRKGPRFVVDICAYMLAFSYGLAGIYWSYKGFFIGGVLHFLVGILITKRLLKTIIKKDCPKITAKSIRSSYMSIWKAFYAEYLIVLIILFTQYIPTNSSGRITTTTTV